MKTDCVYCAVRTESLNTNQVKFRLRRLINSIGSRFEKYHTTVLGNLNEPLSRCGTNYDPVIRSNIPIKQNANCEYGRKMKRYCTSKLRIRDVNARTA
jgi:hypothetical protein